MVRKYGTVILSMLKKEVSLYLIDHLQSQKLQLIVELNIIN